MLVVVAVAILAVVLLAFVGMGSKATVVINVYSTHLLFTVDYTLSADYKQVASGTIGPGQFISYTHTFYWPSGDTKMLYVSATSTGGGFGSESDYADISMSDGGQYTVDLHI